MGAGVSVGVGECGCRYLWVDKQRSKRVVSAGGGGQLQEVCVLECVCVCVSTHVHGGMSPRVANWCGCTACSLGCAFCCKLNRFAPQGTLWTATCRSTPERTRSSI